jgi:hypothetical protein
MRRAVQFDVIHNDQTCVSKRRLGRCASAPQRSRTFDVWRIRIDTSIISIESFSNLEACTAVMLDVSFVVSGTGDGMIRHAQNGLHNTVLIPW